LIVAILISLFDSKIKFSTKNENIQNETQSVSRILIGQIPDIMPQALGNLTGFPKLYSNSHPTVFHYQLFKTNQNTEKALSILMGLKGGDCVRKAEVKIKQICENPLRAIYAKCETCQIPTCLLHKLIESKIRYWIYISFFI